MVRVGMAQMNPVMGDIDGNVEGILTLLARARSAGAEIIAFPELAITGYPPEDLVLKASFVERNRRAVDAVAEETEDEIVVVGYVDGSPGEGLYNAAAICTRGELVATYRKHLLPNYGVFDERRYFEPGDDHVLLDTSRGVIGVCICEDAWYDPGPVISQGDAGAQIVININASPFHKDKLEERTAMLGERARRAKASIVYVNCVGGQDELVFDGGSLVVSPEGDCIARMPQFTEGSEIVEVPLGAPRATEAPAIRRVTVDLPERTGSSLATVAGVLPDMEEIYGALTLGVADYARKNSFDKATIGLSGGIDSALTAAIAADALGAQNVLAVSMPSEFSSSHSRTDAAELANNLGIELLELPIADAYQAYLLLLEKSFGAADMGLAEENIQARIRGNLLMAISNRYGHLVLTTGNKSEMAVGYATLYGDMAGGLAVLKDVFKTEVYDLARWRNRHGVVIPESILTKAPSAELRPNQTDQDSLPPYEVLDDILEGYIERDEGLPAIVARDHPEALVQSVMDMVDRAEFKRRQAPPGIKVTTKAFGRDRRLPITNRWREPATGGTTS